MSRGASAAALARYLAWVRPQLRCTPAAEQSAAYLLDPPGLDEEVAEIWQDIREAVLTCLPDWARQLYGLSAPESNPGTSASMIDAISRPPSFSESTPISREPL